jgi:hypothetical protein
VEKFRRQKVENIPDRLLEKWPAPVLEEGFVPLPKKLLRTAHRIFTGENAVVDLSVIMAIVDFKRPKLSRNPSREFLAFLSGLSRPALDEALTRLQSRGLIEVKESDGEIHADLSGLIQRIHQEAPD